MHVRIYTDGGCSPNPGQGGWGVVLRAYDVNPATECAKLLATKELFGGDHETTNNRMELTAAIKGLEALTRNCHVNVIADSKYVLDGIRKWVPGWKRNNWMTSGKTPVRNRDLWEQLALLDEKYEPQWTWTKGHSNNPGNIRADELATLGRASLLNIAAEPNFEVIE